MGTAEKIYVRLLDEGVDCWRPVDATHVVDKTYRILAPNPDPASEVWEFGSGDLVRCEWKEFGPGGGDTEGLVAVARMDWAV